MSLYRDHLLPWLIHMAMRQRILADYRRRVVSAAAGRVLEIGAGSGLNLPFFAPGVERIIALDPSPRLLDMTKKAAARTGRRVELIEASAEEIPLRDESIDTVVSTWTLCSIPDVEGALKEMRRVLKPGGRLLFVEHGRAPDAGVRNWQDRLTPMWGRIAGGCHLNRDIGGLVERAGLRVKRLETGYMKGPKVFTYMYEGSASREPRP